MGDQGRLTVVIPAHNEEQTVGSVVRSVQEACSEFLHEIVVVNDGSSDSTARVAAEAGARVISHNRNLGYGAALKTGIRSAQTDFVLTMDSDGQHRAEHVIQLWKSEEERDMVVGKRMNLIHSPLWRMPGKWILGLMANYLTGQSIPDLNSGLRLMKRNVALKYLHLCPSGFSFSTTISMVLIKRGYDVAYLPIKVQRRAGKSTVSVTTGLETVILVLRIAALFDPLRVFIPASILTGALGALWSVPYLMVGRGVSIGSMLAIVTAVLLFGIGLVCDQISQLRLERYE